MLNSSETCECFLSVYSVYKTRIIKMWNLPLSQNHFTRVSTHRHAAQIGTVNKYLHSYDCGVIIIIIIIHSGTYFPSAKHSSFTVELLATGTTSGNWTSIFGSYSPITPGAKRDRIDASWVWREFFRFKAWKGQKSTVSLVWFSRGFIVGGSACDFSDHCWSCGFILVVYLASNIYRT